LAAKDKHAQKYCISLAPALTPKLAWINYSTRLNRFGETTRTNSGKFATAAGSFARVY
jgi:hypothetical protein